LLKDFTQAKLFINEGYQQETLKENGMYSIDAISYQIINGKNGMPAFGGRLSSEEVNSIAKYVLEKAENNFEK
jgi:cytochrome c6